MDNQDQVVFRRRSHGLSGHNDGSYLLVDDDPPEETGLRGAKSRCLWAIIIILLVVAVLNAAVTAALLYFLSITHVGMTGIEFQSGESTVRVLDDISVTELVLGEDIVTRGERDLVLSGEQILIGQDSGSKVEIAGNHTQITSGQFEIWTESGRPLFSTATPLNLDLYMVSNLHAPSMEVGSITSTRQYPDLYMEADQYLELVGTEGVHISSEGDVRLNAASEIQVQAHALIFNQSEGLFLSADLPVQSSQTVPIAAGAQYKLCVCAGSGRVFAVSGDGAGLKCDLPGAGLHPCDM
ncbi:uncharacterized protein LOC127878166 [Dreissena polymorpha]|uniref:Beta-sarcoglycan n=1 Tax=Dreissena polymorpha TaxID=45954 RepID=A0A9D4K7D3_DREPO|nr:uncharacterized protein LOC127878166 [Dreissena polymorpha]XP_052280591.1 uncharacterized protein LOC127878166 [Dreissena polymorpha]XP_052280592.1 uncharacterized protein LOC127878166 [Dreissena polymorpha]XP_052280593.1 uncharacterized protein LOC127878166 [Dreissena polymorpha]XP_052280594.1 uncharacterized protein LOC127878166 [Dreissena polymorpha]XP_052280595.1 uncharacterized protein LOC127878166 [Dreissena polymorpha]XP_052280596.1 uncharacterized protein LOC127878166 [Dreissena po